MEIQGKTFFHRFQFCLSPPHFSFLLLLLLFASSFFPLKGSNIYAPLAMYAALLIILEPIKRKKIKCSKSEKERAIQSQTHGYFKKKKKNCLTFFIILTTYKN